MPIEITVPGSKSIANRALILSALTGSTNLKNLPDCDDTAYMQKALKQIREAKKEPIKIHTGNAGTTTRFLTAYCTLLNKHIIIDGDKRMRERPIKELVNALKKLGANISCKKGCPPVEIKPQIPNGGTISLPGNISSQYLSALLLAAPHFKEKTTINIEQELCSQPYINLTLKTQKAFKTSIKNNKFAQFQVEPKKGKSPKNYTIESDASGASYIGAFAALNPAWTILLSNIRKDSLQGDIAFLKCLQKMGCRIRHTKKGTRIRGPRELKRLGTIDMNKTPDLVMTFAALAMFTRGKTTIKNIANLRIKETDRLQALENEIKKFGIKVTTTKDSITIHGDPNHLKTISKFTTKRISIKTYDDHRIAMCFAVLRNRFSNLHIQNPKCVNKSYPTFWKDLEILEQAQSSQKNIVLTGLRGSGKTKLGKIL
ncbi:3-phosphoshikimate 1-carboxyvinyltransferase, partial [Candidatus Peregrinibacteria bacterium]|nr:3-phosphoshikimate 1-carboxyvinyltransferase [Candidatus Peregrinibacteria bacterium]